MARACTLVLALSGLAFAVAAMLSAVRSAAHGPVYAVAEVRDRLARDPHAWVGRALLVRGEVVPCLATPSVGEQPCGALAPSSGRPVSAPLALVRLGPPPVVAFLRRLPLLGELAPAPQVLHWGVVATYRVRVQAVAHSSCGTGVCFEAALLDAASDSPRDGQG